MRGRMRRNGLPRWMFVFGGEWGAQRVGQPRPLSCELALASDCSQHLADAIDHDARLF